MADLDDWKAQLLAAEGEESPDEDDIRIRSKYGLEAREYRQVELAPEATAVDQTEQLEAACLRAKQQLEEQDREIERLEILIVATQPVPGLDPDSLLDVMVGTEQVDQDYRAAKIVHLAKSNRDLNLQVERARTRLRKVNAENDALREQNLAKDSKKSEAGDEQDAHALKKQLSKSKAQLSGLTRKLESLRCRLGDAERDTARVREAIAREVGGAPPSLGGDTSEPSLSSSSPLGAAETSKQKEAGGGHTESGVGSEAEGSGSGKSSRRGASKTRGSSASRSGRKSQRRGGSGSSSTSSPAPAASPGSGWRERAQRIVMLKAKVKRLRSELRAAKNQEQGTQFTSSRSVTDVDARVQQELEQMQQEKRRVEEQVAEEFERLEGEVEGVQKKLKAGRARVKNLEQAAKKSKAQLKVLLNKTSTDDSLVAALRQEVDRLRHTTVEMTQKGRQDSMRQTSNEAALKEASLQSRIEDQQARIAQQQTELSAKRKELQKLRQRTELAHDAAAAADMESEQLLTSCAAVREQMQRLEQRVREHQSLLDSAREQQREVAVVIAKLQASHAKPARRKDGGSSNADMQARLREAQAEYEALAESFQAGMEDKQRQIESLQQMLQTQHSVYLDAVGEMKKKWRRM